MTTKDINTQVHRSNHKMSLGVPYVYLLCNYMLSWKNDTNWSLVGDMRVGDMRVGEMRVGEMRVGKMK